MKKFLLLPLLLLVLALLSNTSFAQTRQGGAVAAAKIDLYRDGGKANVLMTGGGVISLDAATNFKWTQRFIILGGGRGAGTLSTNGYYDINMPAAGTVITGMCGVANQTVGAAGINMQGVTGSWSALWYQLPAGGSGTVNANFKIASYVADCVIPEDYVLIGAFNYDSQYIKVGTGQIIKTGASSTAASSDFFRSDTYGGSALPNGTGDNAKNLFLDADLSVRSMLNFRILNDGRNTIDGLTWYSPTPTSYGLYRTLGAWSAPAYQQAKLAFDTGIELQPSIAGSASPSYTRSYVNISAGGLRVERGLTGLGTLAPSTLLTLNGPSGIRPTGPHIEAMIAGGVHPIYQQLNWSSDNVSTNYDAYFNGSAWTSSGTTGAFNIYKQSGRLCINAAPLGAAGTAITWTCSLSVLPNARVQLPTAPNYASVAAANADVTLLTGTIYTVTAGGGKALYIK
jgi:hypothetical protein